MIVPILTVNLGYVRHNYFVLDSYTSKGCEAMPVIKADAYGFGADKICEALDVAKYFAVARLSEGIALKKSFPDKEFVVFSGVFSNQDLKYVLKYSLVIVIHSIFQLKLLKYIPNGKLVHCWLKYDSGMHRLGLNDSEIELALRELPLINGVKVDGVLSHLSSADSDLSVCEQQVAKLFDVSKGKSLNISMTNSAGLLNAVSVNQSVARFGLALYGISPLNDKSPESFNLKCAYKFSSNVISIREHQPNEPVGYNGTWISKCATRIAVVGVGYADGYPRDVAANTPVLINGKRFPVVGRVSMDLLTVDIGISANIEVGDEVVLWGESLPVELISKLSNRIPYELFTGISNRVVRKYL